MKNIKKRIITLAGLAIFGMSVFCTPASTITVEAANPTEAVTPRSDVIEYRYKEVYGLLYRRLFNYTRDCWVGNWEYVGVVS